MRVKTFDATCGAYPVIPIASPSELLWREINCFLEIENDSQRKNRRSLRPGLHSRGHARGRHRHEGDRELSSRWPGRLDEPPFCNFQTQENVVLYSPTGGADATKLRWAVSPPATHRRPNFLIRDGAGMRLVAAMAEPHPAGPGRHPTQGVAGASRISPFVEEVAENDAQYFRRRAGEERRAADEAAGPEARAAHEDLAERYARLSERSIPSPGIAQPGSARLATLAALLGRRFALSDRMPADTATGREPLSSQDAADRPLMGQSSQAVLIGHRSSVAERKRRLDDLLDEALLETFPASDPVSIVHVR